jgi:hypothetical protein
VPLLPDRALFDGKVGKSDPREAGAYNGNDHRDIGMRILSTTTTNARAATSRIA